MFSKDKMRQIVDDLRESCWGLKVNDVNERMNMGANLIEHLVEKLEKLEARIEVLCPDEPVSGQRVWVISRSINCPDDTLMICRDITRATRNGFQLQSSGINGSGNERARMWAILTRPESEEELKCD